MNDASWVSLVRGSEFPRPENVVLYLKLRFRTRSELGIVGHRQGMALLGRCTGTGLKQHAGRFNSLFTLGQSPFPSPRPPIPILY